ncbi:E3 ubiquitin-protein ligase ATL23-like [Elaeis guineensis]
MVLCAGIGVVFCVHLRLLLGDGVWEEVRGLTEEEVKELEEGKVGAADGAECAVCLEEMVEGEVARVLPGCRHAFHGPCVDNWLRLRSACPLCRARLLPLLSQPKSQLQLPSSSSSCFQC